MLTVRMRVKLPLRSLPPSRRSSPAPITCGLARLRVVYSTSRKDVPIEDLAQLLEAERCGAAAWSGRNKLERAVKSSSAVVAAFIRTEELWSLTGGAPEALTASVAPSKLALVGFARASSDTAFAATVHNMIVHPDVRRRGIGRSVLARLTAQLKRGGVTDIGLMAPESAWEFFKNADFGEDRELSTPMRYVRSSAEPYVF